MIKWLLNRRWFQYLIGLVVAAVMMHLAYKQKKGLTKKGMIFCVTIDVIWKLWWIFVICYMFWSIFLAPIIEVVDFWIDRQKEVI